MTFQCPQCTVVAKSEAGLKKHVASAHVERTEGEILIDGRKRIKTIQDEFTALYPYLGIHFFTPDENRKSVQGGRITPLDGDLTLASVRTRNDPTNADFRLSGRMHVSTLEDAFRRSFGLLVQICQQRDGGSFYSSNESDSVALNDLDRRCAGTGNSRWSYAPWRK